MQMTSAPHLLAEDGPEYERILGDALRHAHERPDLEGVGDRLNTEQLRTMALGATALITAAAATEYEHYTKARDELRRAAAAEETAVLEGARSTGGAGVGAVVTVLTPLLAGAAAVIFLLVGYLLRAVNPSLTFGRSLVTAGWFFACVAAAAILVAAVGLLITALRNGATSRTAEDEEQELPEEVARAREAWRHALLERGILPFLRDALADPTAGLPRASRTVRPTASRRSGTAGRTSPGRRTARRLKPPSDVHQPRLLQPGLRRPRAPAGLSHRAPTDFRAGRRAPGGLPPGPRRASAPGHRRASARGTGGATGPRASTGPSGFWRASTARPAPGKLPPRIVRPRRTFRGPSGPRPDSLPLPGPDALRKGRIRPPGRPRRPERISPRAAGRPGS